MGKAYNPFRDIERRKKRMARPETIASVLKSALSSTGLDKQMLRYTFVSQWEEIVGGPLAARSKPEVIRDGVLIVRVHDSVWAQELSFYKDSLIKRLARFLGDDEQIRDIHFYVAGKRGQY